MFYHIPARYHALMASTARRFKSRRVFQRGRECDVCGQRIEAFQLVDHIDGKVPINGHLHCVKPLKAQLARQRKA